MVVEEKVRVVEMIVYMIGYIYFIFIVFFIYKIVLNIW